SSKYLFGYLANYAWRAHIRVTFRIYWRPDPSGRCRLLDASRRTADIVAVHSEPFPWCCSEHWRFLSNASHRLGGVGSLVRSAYITHFGGTRRDQVQLFRSRRTFSGQKQAKAAAISPLLLGC